MASPIGHVLAGYLGYQLVPVPRKPFHVPRWLLGAVVLANLPDLDFLPGLLIHDPWAFHRQGSHSLALAVVVGIMVGLGVWLAGQVQPQANQLTRPRWWRWGGWATAVYLGHLGLDLLMADRTPPSGIQLLWPFSTRYVASPIALIPGLNIQAPLSWQTLRVVGTEVLLLAPLIVVVGVVRQRRIHRRRLE